MALTPLTAKRSFAFLGHPAHELRAYGWIEQLKPDVMMLTDGSGSANTPRLHYSENNFTTAGVTKAQLHFDLTAPDTALYKAIELQDASFFKVRFDALVNYLVELDIELLLCDGMEAYNSTHDIGHDLARAAAHKASQVLGHEIICCEFALADMFAPSPECQDWMLELSPESMQKKLELAFHYQKVDEKNVLVSLDDLIERYGIDTFQTEQLRLAPAFDTGIRKPDGEPFYETFGKKRVEEGIYKHVITWENHIKPLCEQFWNWAQQPQSVSS